MAARATDRFLLLDAARGIAALAVFLGHTGVLGQGSTFYVAVDLFFMLSGFVIANAYEDRLDHGLSVAAFARIRLVRLYPAYLLGTLIAVAYFVATYAVGRTHLLDGWRLPAAIVAAVFMLPSGLAGLLYPLNSPAWSLFFELFANAVFATWRFWRSSLCLGVIASLSAIVLTALVLHEGTGNLGWTWTEPSLLGGLARVGFGFSVGVLVHRFRSAPLVRAMRLGAIAPLAGLTLILFASPPAAVAGWLPLPILLLLLPLILVALVSGRQPSGMTARISAYAGALSYPLYAIHEPLVYWTRAAATVLHVAPAVELSLSIPAIIGAAWLTDRFFDQPVRQWLTKRLATRAGYLKYEPSL